MKQKSDKSLSTERKKAVNSSKLAVFLLFVLLSVVFWLFNYLSYSYKTDVLYKLRYVDLPEDKILIDVQQKELVTSIYSKGFNLFKVNYFSFNNYLDVKVKSKIRYNITSKRYYILTQDLLLDIKNTLGSDFEINNKDEDTLYLGFSTIVKKKVPVVLKAQLKLKDQYRFVDKIKVSPSMVLLSGPKEVMDTVSVLYTKSFNLYDIDRSANIKVPIVYNTFKNDNIRQNMHIDIDNVDVSYQVSKYTESFYESNIEIVNAKKGFTVFPSYAKIYYKVNISDFNKINKKVFRLGFDMNDVDINNENTALIRVLSAPKNVEVIRIEPVEVQFILKN